MIIPKKVIHRNTPFLRLKYGFSTTYPPYCAKTFNIYTQPQDVDFSSF